MCTYICAVSRSEKNHETRDLMGGREKINIIYVKRNQENYLRKGGNQVGWGRE